MAKLIVEDSVDAFLWHLQFLHCIFLFLRAGNALISLLVRMIPLGTSRSTADLLCLVTMATQVADIITEDSDGMMIEILLSLISELTNRGLPSIQLINSLCSLVEGSDKVSIFILVRINNQIQIPVNAHQL